jgi:hypothetical protein
LGVRAAEGRVPATGRDGAAASRKPVGVVVYEIGDTAAITAKAKPPDVYRDVLAVDGNQDPWVLDPGCGADVEHAF